jgi:50S ribosomal protein L16 3-hydroxylase
MYLFFDMPKGEFEAEYLYKKPRVFEKAVRENTLTWVEVNEIYGRANVGHRSFKLMDGHEVPKSEYVETYINVGERECRLIRSVLYEYMREGATLVYNRISNEPRISGIVKDVSTYISAQTIVSGYAAFSGKSSYRSHWDTRDVFAVQLLGRKRWVIKQPNFELPLYVQQTKDMPQFSEPEDIYLDVVLEQGDVLYIPRGWWHNPLPMGGETFHLAVGTFAPTGFDYIKWLVGLSPGIRGVRHNLQGFEKDQEILTQISNGIAELIQDEIVFESFMEAYLSQQRIESRLSLDVLGNGAINSLSSGAKVRVNANLLYCFSGRKFLINGCVVNLDEVGFELVRYIHDNGSCDVSSICEIFSQYESSVVKDLLFKLSINDVLEFSC